MVTDDLSLGNRNRKANTGDETRYLRFIDFLFIAVYMELISLSTN